MSPVPNNPYIERLNIGARRRWIAILLALAIEGLLLLLLFFAFRVEKPPEKSVKSVTMISLPSAQPMPDPSSADAEQPPASAPEPAPQQPTPETPPPAEPAILLPPIVTQPQITQPIPAPSESQPPAQPTQPNVRPAAPQVYGPPNRGSSASRDTQRVGNAPNGEPMYAAAWYHEPRDDELRGYLSTANSNGWGLIACRTAPDFRVEDCVGIEEYPQGAQINRAVLAAAWQFRVRPPRVGGRSLVGAWVRIRIDYGTGRR